MKLASSRLKIIDYLVVVFEVTYHLSLLKTWTFDRMPINSSLWLLVFIILCHIIRFGGNVYEGKRTFKNSGLLKLLVIISIADILQNLLFNPAASVLGLVGLFNTLFFVSYLANLNRTLAKYELSFIEITTPYYLYCFYNIIAIILAAVLVSMGILDPYSNPQTENSLLADNMGWDALYYFPGHLSLSTPNARFLLDYGIPMLTGLSHEPHVLNFIVLPSLFIVLQNKKFANYKLVFFISYFAVMIISTSTTAFICFFVIMALDMLWQIFVQNDRSKVKYFVLIVFLVAIIGYYFADMIIAEVLNKTVGDNTSSVQHSSGNFSYILNPTTLFGFGNCPPAGAPISSLSIGIISSLLDLSFFALFATKCLRGIMSRNTSRHYISLACLYVFLHGLKLTYLIFGYPFYVFMICLLSFADSLDNNFTERNEKSISI